MPARTHRPALALLLALVVAPSIATAQLSWRRARLDDVDTRFRMPGPYQTSSQRDTNRQGYTTQFFDAVHRSGRDTFVVLVAELEGGVVGAPSSVADGISQQLAERLLPGLAAERRRVSLPGFYADELRYASGDQLGIVRRAVGARRVYVAFAAVARDRGGVARRFVRALRPDRRDALIRLVDRAGSGAWGVVYAPHERFSVHMPAPHRDAPARVEIGGVSAPARLLEGRDEDAVYRVRVVVSDGPTGTEGFEALQDAAGIEGAGRPVQVRGFPGRAFASEGGRRTRIFRGANRWVVLEVEPRSARAAPRADEFFSSLQLF